MMQDKRAFCFKVYLLLTILFLKIVAYCAFCTYYEPYRRFWKNKEIYTSVAIIPYIAVLSILNTNPTVLLEAPCNYILLFLLSTTTTFAVGGLCFAFNGVLVLTAFVIATAMFLGNALINKKWHSHLATVIVSVTVNVVCTIAAALILKNREWVKMICLAVGIQVFDLYAIGEIYYMLEEDYKSDVLSCKPSYILAVMILYTDFICWIKTLCEYVLEIMHIYESEKDSENEDV